MAEVSEGFSFKYVRVCGLAKAKFDRSKLGATGTSMRDVSDCVVTGSCAECGKRKGNSDEVCRIPQKAFEDSKECVNMQQPYAAGGNSIQRWCWKGSDAFRRSPRSCPSSAWAAAARMPLNLGGSKLSLVVENGGLRIRIWT